MSVAEGSTDGSRGVTRPGGAPLTLAFCATLVVIWASLFAMLRSDDRPLWLVIASVIAMEGLAPAYLLARLGRRWSGGDTAILASVLAFMVWGAVLHFQPFSHGLRPLRSGDPFHERDRISYGLYAVFCVALGYKAVRTKHRDPEESDAMGPGRWSLAASLMVGGFVVALLLWIPILRGDPIDVPEPGAVAVLAMIGAIASLVAFSFASSLGLGDRRRAMPRRNWAGSWFLLVAIWWGAIGAYFVLPRPVSAPMLPNDPWIRRGLTPPAKGPSASIPPSTRRAASLSSVGNDRPATSDPAGPE